MYQSDSTFFYLYKCIYFALKNLQYLLHVPVWIRVLCRYNSKLNTKQHKCKYQKWHAMIGVIYKIQKACNWDIMFNVLRLLLVWSHFLLVNVLFLILLLFCFCWVHRQFTILHYFFNYKFILMLCYKNVEIMIRVI